MKAYRIILTIFLGLVALVIPYGIASFTLWCADPSTWDRATRWIVAFLGVVFGCATFGIAWTYLEGKEQS